MTNMRFDGKVAVITGGARGLGRAYAELLASLGAKVVVNDNGSAVSGSGCDSAPAEEAAQALRDAGGEAVASTDTIATPEGGKAIIDCALDTFGRVDVLINNAGNNRYAMLAETSYEDFRAVVDVHLLGAFHVVRPAFERMVQNGYGRVVLTGSIGGLYSMPRVGNYAMSKSGMIGLNNVIAIEGKDFGVRSNLILPGAVTRMAEGLDISQYPPMGPDLVAPVVGYLAHESCAVSGEMYVSIGGRIARAFITETQGVYQPAWTIDDVASKIESIRDQSNLWTFHPLEDGFAEHMRRSFSLTK